MKIAVADLRPVIKALEKQGILLQTDTALPNVAGLLAGEPIKGSWWVHPHANKIFAGLNRLADHEDVLFTKLVSGKVTLIHRRLWPDFLSLATAREAWQKGGLSPAAKYLLETIDNKHFVRSNELEWPRRLHDAKVGAGVKELELRLLIHAEEFHTESGAHAKLLEDWTHWAEHVSFTGELRPATAAKETFEKLMAKLNQEFRGKGRLPWVNTPAK